MPAKVFIAADKEAAGAAAAAVILDLVGKRPDAVLGLATGSSPLPLYRALAAQRAQLANISFFALDEYLGLSEDDPNSYRSFLLREVVGPLGLCPSRLAIPDSLPSDPEAAARDYGAKLRKAGGVDLQILGIGSNGHLGFNEPPAQFDSRCRVVRLAQSTRADNARFFSHPDEVPTEAITQGLGDIKEARRLLLVANGPEKSEPVARALLGPVSEEFPASMIQIHPDATVILDAAAGSALKGAARIGEWQIL